MRAGIAGDRNQIVNGRSVKDAEAALAHQPQVKGSYVRVTDEDLWISDENFRLEVRNHPDRAVAAGSSDNCLDPRVEPHSHEVCGASLVLLSRELPHFEDVWVKDHLVSGPFQRFHAAHEL